MLRRGLFNIIMNKTQCNVESIRKYDMNSRFVIPSAYCNIR